MPNRYYWDACFILEYLNGRPDRAPHVNALMGSASKGDIEIITSTISVAEVAYATHEKAQGSLSDEVEQKIATLWEPGSPIRRVEFHILIAEDARAMTRRGAVEQGVGGLRSVDVMHLATAV